MSGLSIATIVDWASLGKTALAALVATIGVTLSFSLAILGGSRFVDERREGNGAAASLALAGTAIALLASAGAIGIGIAVMIA